MNVLCTVIGLCLFTTLSYGANSGLNRGDETMVVVRAGLKPAQGLTLSEAEKTETVTIWPDLLEGLEYDLNTLLYTERFSFSDTGLNPENRFLKVPETAMTLHFRPDFKLRHGDFVFGIKPRVALDWNYWDSDLAMFDDTQEDVYINEWSVQTRLDDTLFLIVGCENLQWGPSYLHSLSNPFFKENGRANPKNEVAGMDFIRLLIIPDDEWTLSIIANTGQGQAEAELGTASDAFHSSYALKLDYNGQASYASLVLSSHQHPEKYALGWYAGYTASDALILYLEGMSAYQESEGNYPVHDTNSVGGRFEPLDSGWFEQSGILLGGAYTFESGPTLVMEYMHYGYGYDDEQAGMYFSILDRASDLFINGNPSLKGLSARTLSQAVSDEKSYLRENYLMIQLNDSDIRERFDYTVRYTQNIDDGSSNALLLLDLRVGDHTQFFSVVSANIGNRNSEYGSRLFDLYGMLGVEYSF